VKLAEEVARWAEDYDIDWTRRDPKDANGQRQITPIIRDRDRISNEPSSNTMLAALAFHHLAKATGDKLWAAKSEALATAVAQAIDPQSGFLSVKMVPSASRTNYFPCESWTVQLMREYAADEAKAKKDKK
jgi:hypothetical protein